MVDKKLQIFWDYRLSLHRRVNHETWIGLRVVVGNSECGTGWALRKNGSVIAGGDQCYFIGNGKYFRQNWWSSTILICSNTRAALSVLNSSSLLSELAATEILSTERNVRDVVAKVLEHCWQRGGCQAGLSRIWFHNGRTRASIRPKVISFKVCFEGWG